MNETLDAKLGKGYEVSHPWLFRYCKETFDSLTGFRRFDNKGVSRRDALSSQSSGVLV